MVHPFTWYALYTAKPKVFRSRDGEPVNSYFSHIKKTFHEFGVKNGCLSLLFENFVPWCGKSILKDRYELFVKRWKTVGDYLENRIEYVSKTKKEIIILDVGCGAGDLLIDMHKLCEDRGIKLKTIGMDIDDSAIKFANKLKQEGNTPSAFFFVGDIMDNTVVLNKRKVTLQGLFKKIGRPDIVISEGVLEWLDDKPTGLRNIINTGAPHISILTTSQKTFRNAMATLLMKAVTLSGQKGHKGISDGELQELMGIAKKMGCNYTINQFDVKSVKGGFIMVELTKK